MCILDQEKTAADVTSLNRITWQQVWVRCRLSSKTIFYDNWLKWPTSALLVDLSATYTLKIASSLIILTPLLSNTLSCACARCGKETEGQSGLTQDTIYSIRPTNKYRFIDLKWLCKQFECPRPCSARSISPVSSLCFYCSGWVFLVCWQNLASRKKKRKK